MFSRRHALSFALFPVLALALTGCASGTAKPEAAAGTSARAAAPSAPQPAAKATTATSGSSLDALQRGQAATEGPLKEIYFDFDKYDLRPDARATLKANAEWLKNNPSARVQIEGHADERGTNEYNLALGARRAQSAKDYLVSLGIGAERLSTISYGEEVPVCTEKTEECWQRNRRARFVVQPERPTT
ncbi:MAG TPA: peptidoglycan-associated lipoprotein Pal [candidate division Zixibacteria bacterium]|nr:peptidoglycan-associated lipoprotein Pal [candidate division Zixibacteria bacterium]